MGHEFKFEVIPLSDVIINSDDAVADHQPPMVLVVDDEPLIVDSLAAILAHAGLRIVKAYNATSALELAMETPPNLLLTDVAMPGMNGIDLAMAVADALPECKVMLFSAHASTLDLSESRAAGFNFPLLAKPLHPLEMLKRVFECLRREPRLLEFRRTDTESRPSMAWQMSRVNA